MPHKIKVGTIVITPYGDRAMVRKIEGNRATVEYHSPTAAPEQAHFEIATFPLASLKIAFFHRDGSWDLQNLAQSRTEEE